jgi:hypothetical protein
MPGYDPMTVDFPFLELQGSAQWNDFTRKLSTDTDLRQPSKELFIGNIARRKQNEFEGAPSPGKSRVRIPGSKHMTTIASTRSGKGSALIIPNLLIYPGSCFVLDPKGENTVHSAYRREAMGQDVYILDPFEEIDRWFNFDTSHFKKPCFNPLAFLNPDSRNYSDDLNHMAYALIQYEGGEPHWANSARELVAGLVEPPRDCRRLQTLREWSHENQQEIQSRGAGAISPLSI